MVVHVTSHVLPPINFYPLQNKTGIPLCSFENNSEYVYDVQWSPVHPAVFASADGEGRLDLWNMNMDTEVCLGWVGIRYHLSTL